MPPLAPRAAALLVLGALAACGTPEASGDTTGAVGGMDQASAALRAARAGVEPWNAPARPAIAAVPAAPASSAEPGAAIAFASFRAAPLRDTSGLLGATAPAVIRALGQPELRRRDGDAEAWLYRGTTCLLDIVLYPDPAIGREPRVAFAAARAAGLERVPEQACLSEITRAHQLVARARE